MSAPPPRPTAAGEHQVLIVGGGLVGGSLALALDQAGVPVTLAEARPPRIPREAAFDRRIIALAPGSQRLLQALGLWDGLAGEAVAIHRIHVSDRGHCGLTRLDRADEGLPALGWTLPAATLANTLEARLASSTVQRLCPATAEALQAAPGAARLRLQGPEGAAWHRARLVVAADGTDSPLRRQLAIPVREHDYGQSAIIANIGITQPHRQIAYERFTAAGPLAMLPLAGAAMALVWTLPPAQAQACMDANDAAFLKDLQTQFGWRLGQLQRVGERACVPLRLVQARTHVAGRLALIGNASQTLHPVAGQGLNLALRDVATLGELIVDAWRRDPAADPGAASLLQAYAQARQRDQRRVVGITDGLIRVFGANAGPVALLRNLGLLGLDLIPTARRQFARSLMGRSAHPPRLLLGRRL